MNEKKYKITLADGTVIDNLSMNGNNFISKTEVMESTFKTNCSSVIINDGETSEKHNDMELVQIVKVKDEYWFVLRDLSAEELKRIKIEADIEYIAMMSKINL